MRDILIIGIIFIWLIAAGGCGKQMVCPAYQSTFILDDSVRYATFSEFDSDSLPKIYEADKSQFGIVARSGYYYRNIPKETVFHPSIPLDSMFLPFKEQKEKEPVDSLQNQQAIK